MMSEVTPQRDALNEKAIKVNCILIHECNKRNIGLAKHDTMNARDLLQQVWVTLNEKSYIIFALIG